MAVAVEGYEEAPRHETILFNTLTGFVGAFALMRLSTWGQKGGWWPIDPVKVKGRHIHHFVPGILLAFGAGGAGLATSNERLEEGLSFVFGAGVGLTFDEAALLLDLRDVYWTREGVVSLQVSFGLSAVLGSDAARPAHPAPRREDERAAGHHPRHGRRHQRPGGRGVAQVAAGSRCSASLPIQMTCSRPGPTPTSTTGTPTWSARAFR